MKNYYFKKYDRFVNLVWVGVWIGVGSIFFIQFSSQIDFVPATVAAVSMILLIYPFTTYLSKHLLTRAIRKREIGRFVVYFILFSAVMSFFLAVVVQTYYYLERSGIIAGSGLPDTADTFYQTLTSASLIAVFINFGFCGLRFYEENLKLQKILIDSQLEILHAQINPHFMFNVLNHIHVLMQKDVDMASELLLNYSDILRYQLYSGKKEYVRLEDEINFLRNYIDIEKVRWEGKLNVTTSWVIANGNQLISPLLFITFIENAFKHVSRSTSEKGYIKIIFRQEKDNVKLWVENSVSSLKKEKKEDAGIGLENIRQRLNILYPGKYNLTIDEKEHIYKSELTIYV